MVKQIFFTCFHQVAVDEYLDKVVEKEEEPPQPGIASAQDWGSSATPSKVGRRRGCWQGGEGI